MRGEILEVEDLVLKPVRSRRGRTIRVARPAAEGRRRVDFGRPRLINWAIFAALAAFWTAVFRTLLF